MTDRSRQGYRHDATNLRATADSASTRREARIGLASILIALVASLGIYFAFIAPSDLTEDVQAMRELEVISAQELFPRAMDEAHGWRSDANLVRISLDVHPIDLYTFNFETPSDRTLSLSVRFTDSDSGLIVETEQFQSPSQAVETPIPASAWKIDSVEAFEIARSAGAERFVIENPTADDFWLIQLWHWNSLDKRLAWRVSFGALRGPKWEAYIDPITGEVLKIEEIGPAPLPNLGRDSQDS